VQLCRSELTLRGKVSAELLVSYVYVYIRSKSNEMHMEFLCILYFTILALHVSGANCTHHQEHKLQSAAVGTRGCYGNIYKYITKMYGTMNIKLLGITS
jgi:hypothetical protein